MCRRFTKGGIRTPEYKHPMPEVVLPLLYDLKGTRLCKVDGEPARFHRFVDNDRGFLQINTFVKKDQAEEMRKEFNEKGFYTNACTLEKLHQTMALIEWPDGRLSTVAVERVQFTDRGKTNPLEDVHTSEPVMGRRW